MKTQKRMTVVLLGAAVFLVGCTHNLTEVTPESVYARTSTVSTQMLTPAGNITWAGNGIGTSQVLSDPNGLYAQNPGSAAILSAPWMGGHVHLISPKDVKIAKIEVTPQPDGTLEILVEGLEANISDPLSMQVEALKIALPILAEMTKAEALATVEKWKIAGEMTPTVADLLIQIITAFK